MADDLTSSRAALLDLKAERTVMQEGHAFLDEKRTLLAAEMIQQLKRYYAVHTHQQDRYQAALEALKQALARHGLEGLQCYPASANPGELHKQHHYLMGVPLAAIYLQTNPAQPSDTVATLTPEAETCRQHWQALLADLVDLASLQANLLRLYDDYVQTERRTRALEDVLIPELDEQIATMDSALEALELEEAVRVRGAGRVK